MLAFVLLIPLNLFILYLPFDAFMSIKIVKSLLRLSTEPSKLFLNLYEEILVNCKTEIFELKY